MISNACNYRLHGTRNAVSPVIATILMVAITVVLAGVLVAYLQTLPTGGGKIEPPIGLTVARVSTGNWTVSIVSGETKVVDTKLQIINASSGQRTLVSSLTTASIYFYFNDNNSNNYMDAGDIILLNQTAGIIELGFRVQLLKSDSIISGPGELKAG